MMRRLASLFLLIGLVMLAGCGGSPSRGLVNQYDPADQTPIAFGICKSYGCKNYIETGLSQSEWQSVLALFDPVATDAAAERRQIARAIARLETLVGPKTDTSHDAPGAQLVNLDTQGQMDCIDEAFNTTTYLNLIAMAGKLRWHQVGYPLRRGYFYNGWPHNTATIYETALGFTAEGAGHYVVDSWFHGNGQEPEIVLASRWAAGWSPEERRP